MRVHYGAPAPPTVKWFAWSCKLALTDGFLNTGTSASDRPTDPYSIRTSVAGKQNVTDSYWMPVPAGRPGKFGEFYYVHDAVRVV